MLRVLLVLSVLFCTAGTLMAAEEPSHKVLIEDGRFQLREYEPMIVAEYQAEGTMGNASSAGFRVLADFIFGNNQSRDKIEMTAPVTRQRGTKIDMTAPVVREQNDAQGWTIGFIMPSQWTMQTLPKPANQSIRIREITSQNMATVRFSGSGKEHKHREHQMMLEQWLEKQNLSATGEPVFAGYSPPWIPPPLRRNEVMIPVDFISD